MNQRAARMCVCVNVARSAGVINKTRKVEYKKQPTTL